MMHDFPSASYDRWKTTPPDYWYGNEPDPMTPAQEAEEWFDEWFGAWLNDMNDWQHEETLEADHAKA